MVQLKHNNMPRLSLDEFLNTAGGGVSDINVSTFKPATTSPETTNKGPGYFSRVTGKVASDIENRVGRTQDILKRDTGLVTKATQLFGQGAGLAATAGETLATEIPGVQKVLDVIGKGVNIATTANHSPIKILGDVVGSSKSIQDLVERYDVDPNFRDSVDAVANIARLGGDVSAATKLGTGVANKVIGTRNPTITLGGKTMDIDQIHGQGMDFYNKLSPADKEAFAQFDRLRSAKQMLDNAVKTGKDTSDLQAMYDEVRTGLKIPEGSTAIINDNAGLAGTALNIGTKMAESAKPLMQAMGRALKGAGESAYGLTVIPEETTKMAVQAYQANQPSLISRVKGLFTGEGVGNKPITEANTAARLGLAGTEWELGVQAKQASGKIWQDVIKPKLASVKGKVNMKSYFDELEKQIIKDTPELGRRKALLEGLEAFKEDFKNVNNISLEKLQEYKEGWAKFIPEATYKGKPIGSALKDVKNMAAEKARKVIYNNIGEDGKQAYIDYGNLKSIMESGIKTGKDPATRSISRNIWEAVMNKAITPTATFGGKVLYKTGEGLELIGNKGAKTVKDIVK